jgi:hypothetical protein
MVGEVVCEKAVVQARRTAAAAQRLHDPNVKRQVVFMTNAMELWNCCQPD